MKYYLVTGASSGIGRQVAKELSNNETTLILVARRKEKLEELQCELNGDSIVIPCDLCKQEDIEHVFEVLQNKKIKLSGMVYCAGICTITPIKAMDMEALKDMFQINVFAFYQMCKCFAQRSVSEKGSVIVGVSSYAAVTREAGMSAYAMTKEAMNVQVQVLAKEFLKRKITINTVMPANVKSKMACECNDWTEEEIGNVESRQPLGIIPIETVVNTILFLMSEAGKYITGENLAISAGYQI
ncbi:MAG TPA: hypothetical protein DEO89_05570 [Lachnospiraceae bacterium]|nr:hypothetical protein [Lachnospiraceae bacterium]